MSASNLTILPLNRLYSSTLLKSSGDTSPLYVNTRENRPVICSSPSPKGDDYYNGVTTPPQYRTPTARSVASLSAGEPSPLARPPAPQSPAHMPSAADKTGSPFSRLTRGQRKEHNPLRKSSAACIILDDKDEDGDDEVGIAFDSPRRHQLGTLVDEGYPHKDSAGAGLYAKASPDPPAAKMDIFVSDDHLKSFTCPYFLATSGGGIELAIPIVAKAMKIAHSRLASLAPPGWRDAQVKHKAGGFCSQVSPMRVSQSTLLELAPISFSSTGSGCGSTSLALHLPSLTLMAVKIVSIADRCIKGEIEYIRAWSERTVLNESKVDPSSPTLAVYGAFPSAKHKALVFAYEYIHRGSLANCLQPEGLEKTIANESFINSLAFSLLSGLKVISDEGYMHGDIKPSNILVTKAGFCIADYGTLRSVCVPTVNSDGHACCRIIPSPQVTSPFARSYRTEAFSSPERKLGKNVGHLADVWSIGVILSGVSKGIKFCDMASRPEAEDAWAELEASATFSPQLNDLINQATKPDEAARPIVADLLSHPAIKALDAPARQAAFAGASAVFTVPKERVSAQLEVIALALRALKTIGRDIDIATLSVNLARQLETPLDIVRARLMLEVRRSGPDFQKCRVIPTYI